MPLNPLYTFNTAKDEVKRRLGNRSDFGNRLDNWLDSAQSMLAHTQLDLPKLDESIDTFRLTDGIAEYDLSGTTPALTEIVGFRAFYDPTTGYRMTRFPYMEWRSLTDQAEGDPLRWSRRGFRLVFDPIPDSSREIRVEYRREPIAGALEVDNQWQDSVVKLATAIGWSALDRSGRAREIIAEMPAVLQMAYNKPLTQEQWEALWDHDLTFGPSCYP